MEKTMFESIGGQSIATAIPRERHPPVSTTTSQWLFRKPPGDQTPLTETIGCAHEAVGPSACCPQGPPAALGGGAHAVGAQWRRSHPGASRCLCGEGLHGGVYGGMRPVVPPIAGTARLGPTTGRRQCEDARLHGMRAVRRGVRSAFRCPRVS